MICSKCEKEAVNGKVEKGEFVCDVCRKAKRLEKAEIVTFWSFGLMREIRLVKATYKSTPKYYIRQECDFGWPFDHQVSKDSSWRRTPGWHSPEEAVAARLFSLRGTVESKREAHEKADKALEVFEAWAKTNNYDTSVMKNPEERLV